MRLVPFSSEFKSTMTILMILDFGGCWIIEKVLKNAFSDYRPKDIAVRRPDQLRVEEERKAREREEAEKEKERMAEKKANGSA